MMYKIIGALAAACGFLVLSFPLLHDGSNREAEAPLKSAAMIEDYFIEPVAPTHDVRIPAQSTSHELDTTVQVGPKLMTPMGLFKAEDYPSTCFATEENFRERYARDLRNMWNTPLGEFLDDLPDFDSLEWEHVIEWLIEAKERHGNDIKVGAALSYPNDVEFGVRLTAVWESSSVQSLYQRHMEIMEISAWTAAVEYQGDIDYVAAFNREMLNHIRSVIWNKDPDFDFLWSVQKHKDLYE